jgi:hypothetical protein
MSLRNLGPVVRRLVALLAFVLLFEGIVTLVVGLAAALEWLCGLTREGAEITSCLVVLALEAAYAVTMVAVGRRRKP